MTQCETKTLEWHRRNLRHFAPTDAEIDRLQRRFAMHIMTRDRYYHADARAYRETRIALVMMLLETQDHLPFFWIESRLPFCWNSPRDGGWQIDHIRYQIGHLAPRNSSPELAKDPTNLCFMSERCNEHIQSSLPIEDVIELFEGAKVAERIRTVLERRRVLFASDEWNTTLERLSQRPPMVEDITLEDLFG